MTMNVRQSNML